MELIWRNTGVCQPRGNNSNPTREALTLFRAFLVRNVNSSVISMTSIFTWLTTLTPSLESMQASDILILVHPYYRKHCITPPPTRYPSSKMLSQQNIIQESLTFSANKTQAHTKQCMPSLYVRTYLELLDVLLLCQIFHHLNHLCLGLHDQVTDGCPVRCFLVFHEWVLQNEHTNINIKKP